MYSRYNILVKPGEKNFAPSCVFRNLFLHSLICTILLFFLITHRDSHSDRTNNLSILGTSVAPCSYFFFKLNYCNVFSSQRKVKEVKNTLACDEEELNVVFGKM